jgi:hypothetical protein
VRLHGAISHKPVIVSTSDVANVTNTMTIFFVFIHFYDKSAAMCAQSINKAKRSRAVTTSGTKLRSAPDCEDEKRALNIGRELGTGYS